MEINIVKSNRKTVAIQVNEDLSVTIRAPWYATRRELERIIREKEPWIIKQQERISKEKTDSSQKFASELCKEEIQKLALAAKEYIPGRVAYYASLMGVTYGRITIRNQKTRWGSCSSKGNLNFNCRLMLAPKEAIDYVVVHELSHRKKMNHSPAFWAEVEKFFPDYRKWRKYLRTQK